MLTRRRPVKARTREGRRTLGAIDFPQLRRDVMLLSDIGFIIRESRYYRRAARPAQVNESR